jgi:hypothetical protein
MMHAPVRAGRAGGGRRRYVIGSIGALLGGRGRASVGRAFFLWRSSICICAAAQGSGPAGAAALSRRLSQHSSHKDQGRAAHATHTGATQHARSKRTRSNKQAQPGASRPRAKAQPQRVRRWPGARRWLDPAVVCSSRAVSIRYTITKILIEYDLSIYTATREDTTAAPPVACCCAVDETRQATGVAARPKASTLCCVLDCTLFI